MKKLKILTSVLSLSMYSCTDKVFTTETQTDKIYHVKNDDYLIPVMVRGNTAGKKIILYVQGGPAGNTFDFATIDYPEWKNTLEKDYAVAYYEQRGTGNRQGNFGYGKSILDTYVEDLHKVATFLEKAYNAEIIMMGHSFGGGLMFRYMVEKGQDGIPKQYIALNAPVTTDKGQSESLRWKFRRDFLLNSANLEISRGNNIERWQEVLAWLNKNPEIKKTDGANPYQLMIQWNSYVEQLIYEYYPEKNLRIRDYLKVIFASPYNPIPAYLREDFEDKGIGSLILRDEENYQILYKLNQINHQKILLITGRFDDICVPEELTYAFEQIISPNKQLKIIDLAGHEAYLHQKVEFLRTIKRFIQ